MNSENQDELAGVICHEIAHIELNHVMKKLMKEIGLSVLVTMITGNSRADTIKETAKVLSSAAFDRSLEREADIKAVDYMINAELNSERFANFLLRVSESENDKTKHASWISSHPDSKERAKYIVDYYTGSMKKNKPILSKKSWENLKSNLK